MIKSMTEERDYIGYPRIDGEFLGIVDQLEMLEIVLAIPPAVQKLKDVRDVLNTVLDQR